MRRFEFDVRLLASVQVDAETADEARRLLDAAMNCASVNAGAWPNGDPILFDASQDGYADLIEVSDDNGDVTVLMPRATA